MVLQSSSLEIHVVGRRHSGEEQNKAALTVAAAAGVVEQVGDVQS